MLRRVYAALGVADKRSFQMNPQRKSAVGAGSAVADPVSQVFKRGQRSLEWSGDRGGQVTGHPVPQHVSLNVRDGGILALHHVMPGAAVNVNVNEPRGQYHAGKIKLPRSAGYGTGRARGRGDDARVFNDDQRRVDSLRWRVETGGCDGSLHSIAFQKYKTT